MNQKQSIRKQIIQKIGEISPNDKKRWSNAIFKKLINLPLIQRAQTIGLYYAMLEEVTTKGIIEYFLNQKKQVYLPKISAKKQMQMVQISSLNFVNKQNQNFFEPIEDNINLLEKKIDCMIVPGLAFDQKNNRLGRGQGHYDQYLKKYQGDTIMLAFEIQKVDNLPTDLWDIPISIIVTERSIYKV